MPPNPASNSRLPRLAVLSGYGTARSVSRTKFHRDLNKNFYQFRHTFSFLNGLDKKPKQIGSKKKKKNDIHTNKKPRVFADEPPSAAETFFGALSQ